MIEKLAAKKLNLHLQDNSFEEELQSAYRTKHSTETALMKVHSDITRGLDGGEAAMLVLFICMKKNLKKIIKKTSW